MPTALIIGTGPGAAGAALALTADPSQRVTVIDVGGALEPALRSALQRLATKDEEMWSPADVESISHQPVPTQRGGLPQKRAFGSDFPFRDVGQLAGIEPLGSANPSVVSGAMGVSPTSGAPKSCPFETNVRRGRSHGSRWSRITAPPWVRCTWRERRTTSANSFR